MNIVLLHYADKKWESFNSWHLNLFWTWPGETLKGINLAGEWTRKHNKQVLSITIFYGPMIQWISRLSVLGSCTLDNTEFSILLRCFTFPSLPILSHSQRQPHENHGIFYLIIHPSYGALLTWSHIILYVCSGTRQIVYVINHGTVL